MNPPTTTTPTPLSPRKAKHPIPPPWYYLQNTNTNDPYIALPPSPLLRPPIFLTRFYPSDAPALQATLSIPSINAPLISVPHPYTLSSAHSWLNLYCNPSSASSSPPPPPNDTPPTHQPWLQALRTTHPDETGTFIGSVSLTPADSASYALLGILLRDEGGNDDDDDGERGSSYVLGYYLHPAHHGCGIMRDAVCALLAWGVAERGVRKVRADIEVENWASRAVVEGIEGFEKCGGEEEEVQVEWPEGKGGGVRRVGSWVWKGRRGDRGRGGG